LFIIHFF